VSLGCVAQMRGPTYSPSWSCPTEGMAWRWRVS
jgi:hypothetical protein